MVTLRPVVNVYYFVEDLAAAIVWYGDLLGAQPSETYGVRLLTFAVGDTRLTLHNNAEYNANAVTRGTVAYRDVDDVDATVAECVQRGAVVHRGWRRSLRAIGCASCRNPVRQPAGHQTGRQRLSSQGRSFHPPGRDSDRYVAATRCLASSSRAVAAALRRRLVGSAM